MASPFSVCHLIEYSVSIRRFKTNASVGGGDKELAQSIDFKVATTLRCTFVQHIEEWEGRWFICPFQLRSLLMQKKEKKMANQARRSSFKTSLSESSPACVTLGGWRAKPEELQ